MVRFFLRNGGVTPRPCFASFELESSAWLISSAAAVCACATMTLGIILLLTASSSGLTNLRVIPDARLGARPRTARAAPQTLAGRVTPPRAARSRSSSPHCSAIALARVALDPKLIAVSVGGTFAGGLHAVTGPDHLAALLPLCIGRRWWTAINTGLYWGTRRTLLHLSPRSPATKTRTPPPAPAAAAVSLVSHTRLDSQASAMALVPRWWARSPFAFATR